MKARAIASSERALAVEVLVSAFDQDPLATWLYPDAAERHRAHRTMFAREIASTHAIVEVTGDLDGAAIWYPPGLYPTPEGGAPQGSAKHSSALFESIDAARPPGELWFLAFLGARTPGLGAGSALVRHRLALAKGVALCGPPTAPI